MRDWIELCLWGGGGQGGLIVDIWGANAKDIDSRF